ncbi:MAG: hypothetical protein PVI40_04845 [Chlamydiota bacterium]|jgi:hypothetical protein
MSVNNSNYSYQRVNDEPSPWDHLIKCQELSTSEKMKSFVSSIFGVKSEWIERKVPFEGTLLFNREFLEILEDLQLTPIANDHFHRSVPVRSILHKIYENTLKLENPKQMEKSIVFLKKLYLNINPNIIKSKHITKALAQKNDLLLELIFSVNPSLYLTYLLGRYHARFNPQFIHQTNASEKLHAIAKKLASPIIEIKSEEFLNTQSEDINSVEDFLLSFSF